MMSLQWRYYCVQWLDDEVGKEEMMIEDRRWWWGGYVFGVQNKFCQWISGPVEGGGSWDQTPPSRWSVLCPLDDAFQTHTKHTQHVSTRTVFTPMTVHNCAERLLKFTRFVALVNEDEVSQSGLLKAGISLMVSAIPFSLRKMASLSLRPKKKTKKNESINSRNPNKVRVSISVGKL